MEPLPFADAEQAFVVLGGHLASIHTAQVNAFIAVLGGLGAYVGGTDAASEGTFVWTDGSPFDFTNWLGGEPNNSGDGEDCLQINDSLGGWNDVPCGGAHFVCKL